MKIEPVGRMDVCVKCKTPFGREYYCPKCGYDTCVEEPAYTEAQLRQLGEACAASCDAIAKGRNSVVGTRCADSVRRLIKEMLP